MKSMTTLLINRLTALTADILDACGNEVVNDISTINDMADPERAHNNCGFASERAIYALQEHVFLQGLSLTYTGIQTPAGNHYAVLVSEEGKPQEESVIIDFTARQFDASLPFPLIMDCWEWQQWTEAKIGRQGNWYHSYHW